MSREFRMLAVCSIQEEKGMEVSAERRQKHSSSGANIPSDISVTVNINAEFNQRLI